MSGNRDRKEGNLPKQEERVYLPQGRLAELMRAALLRRGVSEPHSRDIVDGLLLASSRGVDTHGVVLFPLYLAELDGGRAKPRPKFHWEARAKSAKLLRADHALGLVAGQAAAREAVALAEAQGLGGVAVAESNHFGAASVYTLEMARRGMIGLSFSNSDALVAPHGGKVPFLGTNPLSMAVEGQKGDVFCVDMATSQVAFSRVKRYRESGTPISHGWALTQEGQDAADAETPWSFGAMQPLGGYKGQCLAMMVEILCSLLTGMPMGHELKHLFEPPFDQPRQTSHFMLAIKISAFQESETFKTRLSAFLESLREQSAVGSTRIMAPGDLERASTERRRRKGIPIPPPTWRAFQRIAQELSFDLKAMPD